MSLAYRSCIVALESTLAYSISTRPPCGGLYALVPSLAALSPSVVPEGPYVTVVANLKPLCQFDCLIAFVLNAVSGNSVRVMVLRTDQDRKYLAVLSKPGGMSGKLMTYSKPVRIAGRDVYECW